MLTRTDTPDHRLTCDQNPAPVIHVEPGRYHRHLDDVWTCRGTLTAKFQVGA